MPRSSPCDSRADDAKVADLDQALSTTMSSLKEQFFASIHDLDALQTWSHSWSAFQVSVQAHKGVLSEKTTTLIHAFASTVDTVISNIVDCEGKCDLAEDRLVDDIQAFLESDSMGNLTLDDPSSSHKPAPAIPAYVELASTWILNNLRNPYPEAKDRFMIAKQAKCERRDVDAWFTDHRKRIGWNALRREVFANKREDIVGAANAFYSKTEASLAFPAEIREAFAIIKQKAEKYHEERFKESKLAVALTSVVKDMTPELMNKVAEEKRRNKKVTKRASKPYPTPSPSPENSTKSLSPSPEPQPVSPTSLKRRRSVVSNIHDPDCRSFAKRTRVHIDHHQLAVGLPSPVASDSEDIDAPEQLAPAPENNKRKWSNDESESQDAPGISQNKKRRLSDLGTSSARQRVVTSHAVALTDSLPLSTQLTGHHSTTCGEWLSEFFSQGPLEVPPHVSLDLAPDFGASTPLDIQVASLPFVDWRVAAPAIVAGVEFAGAGGDDDQRERAGAPSHPDASATGGGDSHAFFSSAPAVIAPAPDDAGPQIPQRLFNQLATDATWGPEGLDFIISNFPSTTGPAPAYATPTTSFDGSGATTIMSSPNGDDCWGNLLQEADLGLNPAPPPSYLNRSPAPPSYIPTEPTPYDNELAFNFEVPPIQNFAANLPQGDSFKLPYMVDDFSASGWQCGGYEQQPTQPQFSQPTARIQSIEDKKKELRAMQKRMNELAAELGPDALHY